MNYAIVGTGAIGGFYGARLSRVGKEVHFLLHSDYEYVAEHGLRVDSCDGDFLLDHVNAYASTESMPKVDVAIVALKTTRNHLLATLLPPLLHERSLVLLIQNGIGVEEDVQRLFPGVYLAAGLAFICSAKVGQGHVSHQCYGSINIGNFSCSDPSIIAALVDDFRSAGITVGEVPYYEARWKKAVWNMPFNGMTVALHTQTDRLLANPHTERLIREQMMEVIGASRALGVKGIDDSFADQMIATTKVMVPYSPSMRLDYDFHRPMELEYLYHRPISMAAEAGFAMPRLAMLADELEFLAEGNR